MSAANCFLSEDQLLCGICLDVFTDPVTLPCGHNFCQKCITQHWDSNSKCECPTCKYPFYKKLDLRVNNFISEMAAQFSRSRSDSSDQQLAKPGEVPCDICTDTKCKAVKSCLVCLASYCDNHLQSHLTVPCLKRHQLTDPVENLEGRMCKIHEKPLELFCKTDQICVCMLCPVLDHKSHEVIPLKEQFERRKADLGKTEAQIHRKIQKRRLKIQEFKNVANVNKESGDREKADGVQVFNALIRSLEISKAKLIEEIEAKQKETEKKAKAFIGELEQEISELIRKRADVDQLSRSKDYIHVLQSFASLEASALSKDWTEVSIDPPSYEGTLRNALDQLDETLGKEMDKALRIAELNRVQKCAVDMVLDPDSAHHALVISADGKQVHHAVANKKLANTPKRFDPSCCVLGKEGFSSGKFYFEIVVREKTRWTVGVAKESIKRKGIIPLSPENGHWTMWLKNGDEYAALVGSPLKLSLDSKPQKVGVFVDYDAGLVSFYNVDTADLLYSFAGCSFTERIYPFFSPGLYDDGINSVPLTLSSIGH
ncbi:E3 ubiquitin-protein ligase TRIM21-like [Pseudochaenichthys georgianus]|uniref:E3 ubiquitin-protein ligase TRIM21-like n=1 Tax=Pseudochaenichthys georgianus TaxID=52239 RepID=UPI00146DB62F|nr:E3 ubiquitin-protein ligase TRIM39-like [Pseudochaenichthys georgianus]